MLLEKPYERILLSLNSSNKSISELLNDIGGSATTLEKKLSVLLTNGFVGETISDQFPFRRVINLTNKGKKTVKMLKGGKI